MAWLFANILLPLLAPTAVLLLLRLLPIPPRLLPRLNLLLAIKDGQLCFISMGFSAAAMFELDETGWLHTMLIVLFVLSSLLASGGTVFHTHLNVPPGRCRVKHFRCMLSSILFTVASAVAYTYVHFLTG